jgi:hypothetical protein
MPIKPDNRPGTGHRTFKIVSVVRAAGVNKNGTSLPGTVRAVMV